MFLEVFQYLIDGRKTACVSMLISLQALFYAMCVNMCKYARKMFTVCVCPYYVTGRSFT